MASRKLGRSSPRVSTTTRLEDKLLEAIDVAEYCTLGRDDGRDHRLVLVLEDARIFWACVDCDPNALKPHIPGAA